MPAQGACLEEGESGGVEDGRPASSTTAAAAVEGTAVAAPPLNVVTPKEGMADVEAASSGAGAARSGTDVVTDLPEPGVRGELWVSVVWDRHYPRPPNRPRVQGS